ncbi:aspartyl-phosphate phosphatase Spo0E family protein [Paenibacillus validus]|uniref:Spo0E family sporulation regulatory protein-aspartic acid phosphatase n=1 Tax=Paenibacillus validus TaxID=44253 RepID=A0A7X2ZAX7_9BACL|nr:MULTISPECIES: aspartyl-phosphate phosphatase Spo0E family protein [Paenibacillus]MED4602136.1 aspartyl-phosphate phosphatase Spo0E family protein [Paenibacillus validus]MED4608621.1 aspartyl-phosphate phosphatase Spo0E family protein [Paenibacillus validus]MUG70883.1 Spo0E family sporulation regulatory protein-aspartic acid phosphatase [Paenibacillus validus]
MAFPEYRLRQYLNVVWIQENDRNAKWIFGKRKTNSSATSLEDEIYRLRQELESLVQSGNTLTSPRVVEISMELDIKINEYMNRHRGSRS